MTVTVVTAFYPLQKSKHSIDKYNEWIKNFCKFNCNLVVFTTSEYASLIENLRFPIDTRIIVKSFDSYAVTAPDMMRMWEKTYKIDPEAHIHSPELYAVWAMKQECVLLAIQDNPFDSTHFVWCDIGIQRYSVLNNMYNTFPSCVKQICDEGRLTFLEIVRIPDNYYLNWKNNIPLEYPLPLNALGGGCIAGDIEAWGNFCNAYISTLKELDSKNIFIGKDQGVFLTMLLNRKTRKPFKLILPVHFSNISGIDWMSLPVILGGKADVKVDERFEENIPCKSVGVMFLGGLGNQLFQAATAIAYSKKYNKQLTLPDKSVGSRPTIYYKSFMYNLQQYVYKHSPGKIWKEPSFSYTEIPKENDILYGYFQSSKYFNDVSGEIRTLFDPNPIVKNVVSQKYADLLASSDKKVVIHVRRGDYLAGGNQSVHAITTDKYYKDAIELMKKKVENPEFMVFSDDLDWCKGQEFFEGATFVDEKTDYLALHLMSQFKHYIIPNSTFSWWATWLGTPAETVIAPDRWFGPNGPQDYQDIYESHWIRIPTI